MQHISGLHQSLAGLEVQALAPSHNVHRPAAPPRYTVAGIVAQVRQFLADHPGATLTQRLLREHKGELPSPATVDIYCGGIKGLREALGLETPAQARRHGR